MHFSLGQIKEAHNGEMYKVLFLLKGSGFQPPFDGVFRRSISEKKKIIELMKSNKKQNSASGSSDALNARQFAGR